MFTMKTAYVYSTEGGNAKDEKLPSFEACLYYSPLRDFMIRIFAVWILRYLIIH